MKLWPLMAVVFLNACATTPASAPLMPGLVRVADWGGKLSGTVGEHHQRIERITLHHGGVTVDPARSTDEYLRNLQQWSRRDKGWIDLPYHFLIDHSGRVFEGRNLSLAGDTNTGYNPSGHALVAVLGNFDEEEPSPAQLQALINVMAWLVVNYDIPLERIAGHSNFSSITVCPGKHLDTLLRNGWLTQAVAARAGQLKRD